MGVTEVAYRSVVRGSNGDAHVMFLVLTYRLSKSFNDRKLILKQYPIMRVLVLPHIPKQNSLIHF